MKKPIVTLLSMTIAGFALATPPEISNVRAAQRTGTKLVDITYDAVDADGDLLKIRVEISDNDGRTYSIPANTFTGDIGDGIAPGTGKKIVWDAGTDWDGEYSDQMRVKIFAIDAQGFPGMEWGNEIPPGGFLLGQDGGAEGSGPSRHVNIPWSYWLSKYEVTAGQYCNFLNAASAIGLVYRNEGSTEVYNSITTNQTYACCIPYSKLCDIGDTNSVRWNVNKYEAVSGKENYPIVTTRAGALLFARFYGYDIPTEAEWEKAARGSDHDDQDEHLMYPWGDTISSAYANISSTLKEVGYYDGNQTPVGPDTINAYALYDVIGNAPEWTRTRFDCGIETYPSQESLSDPRQNTFQSTSTLMRGTGSNAIYKRDTGYYDVATSYYGTRYFKTAGFRVVRRHDAEKYEKAVCVLKEDFNEWEDKSGWGNVEVTSNGRVWKLDQQGEVGGYGVEKSKGVCLSSGQLYIPSLSGRLAFLRLKVNPESSSGLALYSVANSTSTGTSYSLPGNGQMFYTIDLPASQTQESQYYLSGSGIVIDDIEVWCYPNDNQAE